MMITIRQDQYDKALKNFRLASLRRASGNPTQVWINLENGVTWLDYLGKDEHFINAPYVELFESEAECSMLSVMLDSALKRFSIKIAG